MWLKVQDELLSLCCYVVLQSTICFECSGEVCARARNLAIGWDGVGLYGVAVSAAVLESLLWVKDVWLAINEQSKALHFALISNQSPLG
eukprot:m.52214 g.52214  ORF g.52214 m.52214 type:complete len:89 (+) comp11291_c0_seq2:1624-1890(+)